MLCLGAHEAEVSSQLQALGEDPLWGSGRSLAGFVSRGPSIVKPATAGPIPLSAAALGKGLVWLHEAHPENPEQPPF